MGLVQIPEASIEYFKRNLDGIFDSGTFAEGPWNKKLSKYVKTLTGAVIALPTSSNGAGIVSLLSIYRHYHKRKAVMIQSNTMYGVKTMVIAGGCNLVGYIGCHLDTLMPSFEDVKNAIMPLNKDEKGGLIILLSHIGGIINPDIESIAGLCKKENIVLLEDCAHSFGATLFGKHSGLFGNAGVYSYYATKAVPAGEGGLVVTNNEELGNTLEKYSIYDRFDQNLEIGNNIRVSEMQALLIYSVIKEWENIVANKKEVAKKYIEICNNALIQFIDQEKAGHCGNYYKFIIYSEKGSIQSVYPNLKTFTSPVYNYSIGSKNMVADLHACLPIWYLQEDSLTNKVLKELATYI